MGLDAVLFPKITSNVDNDFLPGEGKALKNVACFGLPPDEFPANIPNIVPARGITPHNKSAPSGLEGRISVMEAVLQSAASLFSQ